MATFDAPDYIIGNSASITASLSSVLTQLDQALQALEPAPNATTVQFNNAVFIQDPTVLTQSATLEKNRLDINDGTYTSTYQPSILQMTDNGGTYLDHSITFQMASNPQGNLHSAGSGNGDNREVYFKTDDTGHPLLQATLYETSTIIRDDYIKIGNKSYNPSINSGDLYCNNVSLNTINGLTPTTIGLTWADFTGLQASANLPQNSGYSLDSGTGTSSYLNAGYCHLNDSNNNREVYLGANGLQTTNTSSGEQSSITPTSISFSATANPTVISNSGGFDLTVQSSNQLLLVSSDIASITAGSSFNVIAGDAVNITANNDYVSIQADDNITLYSAGLGDINLNAPNINSYGYAMPICFTRERNDSFTYNLGGQQMEFVYQTQIAIPYQFFTEQPQGNYTSTKWKIDFALNCYSNTNTGDKGLALYFDFQDITSTFTFTPNTYNGNYPYAVYQQTASYGGGSGAPYQNFNWTDWCDFGALQGQTSSVLPLTMRLYFAGDSGFSCNFYMAITLTRTNMI